MRIIVEQISENNGNTFYFYIKNGETADGWAKLKEYPLTMESAKKAQSTVSKKGYFINGEYNNIIARLTWNMSKLILTHFFVIAKIDMTDQKVYYVYVHLSGPSGPSPNPSWTMENVILFSTSFPEQFEHIKSTPCKLLEFQVVFEMITQIKCFPYDDYEQNVEPIFGSKIKKLETGGADAK